MIKSFLCFKFSFKLSEMYYKKIIQNINCTKNKKKNIYLFESENEFVGQSNNNFFTIG